MTYFAKVKRSKPKSSPKTAMPGRRELEQTMAVKRGTEVKMVIPIIRMLEYFKPCGK